MSQLHCYSCEKSSSPATVSSFSLISCINFSTVGEIVWHEVFRNGTFHARDVVQAKFRDEWFWFYGQLKAEHLPPQILHVAMQPGTVRLRSLKYGMEQC